jgi:hypothetical protein
MIASALITGAILLGGCGGGSTPTTASPSGNADHRAQTNTPPQEHLTKDNPTQVPVGEPHQVKAALGKDNRAQVPLSKDNPSQVPLGGEADGMGAGG